MGSKYQILKNKLTGRGRGDDLYIEILKYGKDKLLEGITFEDLQKHLERINVDYDKSVANHLYDVHFSYKNVEENTRFLKSSGYFHLLEYMELKEARASARLATLFATAALIVSIISTSASIYFSIAGRCPG